MSYNFTYRHFLEPEFFLIAGLPLILRTIFMIIVNYYILRASKRQPEGVKKTEYLKWCAIINLIFTSVPLFLPELVIVTPTFPPQDLSFIIWFYILTGLIMSVPFLVSYGILIFLFARQNRENLGSYLYIAGICFLVSYSLSLIILGGNVIPIFLYLDILPYIVAISTTIFGIFTGMIALIGFIFLLIHSVNKRDFNFKMAAIFYFIGLVFTFIFGFVASFFVIINQFFS
jgi:hypothetical protein